MGYVSKINLIITFILLIFSCVFCASNLYAGEKTTTVYIKVFTNENLNKDVKGEASPLKITFLQLLNRASFEQMDESHVEDNFKEYFGHDLLEEYSLMIRPDDILEFSVDVNDAAKYLGVILVFRDLSGNWKNLYEKQRLNFFSMKKNYLNFEINEDELVQLSLKETAKLTLNKQLKKLEQEGIDASGLSEKALKQLEVKIEKNSIPKVKNSLEKGIYKKY